MAKARPYSKWTTTDPSKIGEPVGGFPQTQEQMEEWQTKYVAYSGKWYEKAVETPTIPKDPEPPFDPTDVDGGGEVVIPDNGGDPPDITSFSESDYWAKRFETEQKEQERIKKEKEAAKAEAKTEETTLWDKLLGKDTVEEKREAEYEELGVDKTKFMAEWAADIAEVESLMKQFNDMTAMKEADIAQIESQPMSMRFIEGKSMEANKKWNIKLSHMSGGIKLKLAIMDMKNDRFTEAKSLVAEAVNDYTYDLKLEYDRFTDFRERNDAEIAELDQEYRNALNRAETSAKNAYDVEQNRLTNVLNLMLQYPSAGITKDDTLAEATQKASGWKSTQPADTDFTNQELRRLEQAGLTNASRQEQLNYLYGDEMGDKDLIEDLSIISTYGSREEALTALNNQKTALILSYGQSGYDQLLAEVDRLFPEAITDKKTITPTEAGEEVGGTLRELPGALAETVSTGVKRLTEVIDSFWSGLFGS